MIQKRTNAARVSESIELETTSLGTSRAFTSSIRWQCHCQKPLYVLGAKHRSLSSLRTLIYRSLRSRFSETAVQVLDLLHQKKLVLLVRCFRLSPSD